jgi:hypothetical protein
VASTLIPVLETIKWMERRGWLGAVDGEPAHSAF